MAEKILSGACLCGAVTYELTGPFDFFGFCQCSLCRKATGGAFASNLFVALERFTWASGEDNRIDYKMPPPKKFGNAACKTCGSRVPRVLSSGDRVLIPAGSIMEDPGIAPTLVCTEDHTEWFTGLEKAVSGQTQ